MSYLNLFEEHSLFFMFLAALAEEISLASYAREEEGIHRGRFCSPRPVELYIPSGELMRSDLVRKRKSDWQQQRRS